MIYMSQPRVTLVVQAPLATQVAAHGRKCRQMGTDDSMLSRAWQCLRKGVVCLPLESDKIMQESKRLTILVGRQKLDE